MPLPRAISASKAAEIFPTSGGPRSAAGGGSGGAGGGFTSTFSEAGTEIVPQPEVDGLPQVSLAGPFGELHLGDQLGADKCGLPLAAGSGPSNGEAAILRAESSRMTCPSSFSVKPPPTCPAKRS